MLDAVVHQHLHAHIKRIEEEFAAGLLLPEADRVVRRSRRYYVHLARDTRGQNGAGVVDECLDADVLVLLAVEVLGPQLDFRIRRARQQQSLVQILLVEYEGDVALVGLVA